MQDPERHIIRPDTYIMIKLPSGNFRVEKLEAGSVLTLGKFGSFQVNEILGHPFGFTYEIQPDQTVKIVKNDFEADDGDIQMESNETNQDLNDDPTIQQLTNAEIEQLKTAGVNGQELIEKVINSHGSFNKKTALSQAKYLLRKQRKFLQRFTPEPIGSNELIEIYSDKDRLKIMKIGPADLGMLFSVANIRPGGTYLVVDDIKGIIVSGLIERMGGEGTIILAHGNEQYNSDALKYMNLSEEDIDNIVKPINWLDLLHPEENNEFETMSIEELEDAKPAYKKQYYRRKQRHDLKCEIQNIIRSDLIEGLIVASELYLPTLIPKLIDFLQGSASIAIYSEYKEILISTNDILMKDLRVLGPAITESRVRKYQTTPGKIHPNMTSDSVGGYILSGTKVIPSQGISAAGKHSRKKKPVDDDKVVKRLKQEN